MSHTPGPWVLDEYDQPRTPEGLSIAEVTEQCHDGRKWRPDLPDMPKKANARLIAAAPELLALLKRWVEVHGSNNPNLTAQSRKVIEAAESHAGRVPPKKAIEAMNDSPRTKRLINRIYEAFADVGQPGASVNEAALRLRAEIAYDTMRVEEKVYPPEEDCPHAAPFRFCPNCVVTPCPIGLDRKATA